MSTTDSHRTQPQNLHENMRLSEDLTVVLLRGNGSPRTFRLSLPALQRSLTALGFFFTFAVLAAIGLLVLNLVRPSARETVAVAPQALPPPVIQPSVPATETSAPFWKGLTGRGDEAKGEDELRRENEALRADLSRLSGLADSRKELPQGQLPGLLQFFGPRNIEEGLSPIAVKNVRVALSGKDLTVDFELHNVDPEQKTARGYIVVLAKSAALLAAYPEGAFSPTQNIVLDYTKGETFGVSRFREARATFKAGPFEGQKPRFQVLLFANDGRVINNLHVDGSGGGS